MLYCIVVQGFKFIKGLVHPKMKISPCFTHTQGIQGSEADLVNWGPQANIGMGPYTFAHIYLDQPRGSFFVVMLAAAQWRPIVESNVSTVFMYML